MTNNPVIFTTTSFNGNASFIDYLMRIQYSLFRTFPYAIPLMNTLQLCSIYYTVAVSFDRLLYLSYGVQADSICNVKNSLRTIATITIFAIVFILPHWFKHRVVVTEKKVVQLKRKKFVLFCRSRTRKQIRFVFFLVQSRESAKTKPFVE